MKLLKEREMKVNDISSIFDNLDELKELEFCYSSPLYVEEAFSFFIKYLQIKKQEQEILKKFKEEAID